MKISTILLASFGLTLSSHAALIAYEGFDYTVDGYTAGLEGKNGGSGFSSGWAEFGASNVSNGVFAGNITAGSNAELPQTGNHARVQLSSSGVGVGRNLSSALGADNTTVWLSVTLQNNNNSASEAFAPFFTTIGGARSTMIGATSGAAGQNASDGQFDLVNGSTNVDYAARDQANHLIVIRFDFGAANNDTVTIFNDPTLATDYTGSGSAQITGINAAFDGVGMTATGATLQVDEIRIGDTVKDVTAVPEPSSTAILGLSALTLILRRRR